MTNLVNQQIKINNSVNKFNHLEGRLRIAITPKCQMNCFFCHNEGFHDKRDFVEMSRSFFEKLVYAFSDIGGREINITGGEPLLHPQIKELLLFASKFDLKLTISTNGLELPQKIDIFRKIPLYEVKISMHAIKMVNERKEYFNTPWNLDILENVVKDLAQHKQNVTLNFVLHATNEKDLINVIKLSLDLGVNLKIIELADFGHLPAYEKKYRSVSAIEKIVRRYANLQEVLSNHTGCALHVFRSDRGPRIMLKDHGFGLFHTPMCHDCSQFKICREGIFALRVNSRGIFLPCLLRNDLQTQISPESNFEVIKDTMKKQINLMMTGLYP